jgi:hypothetical protein
MLPLVAVSRKLILTTIFLSLLQLHLLLQPRPSLAATASLGAIVTPKLSLDHRAVNVTFSKLNNIESVSYSLTYTGSGLPQGAGGSLIPAGQISVSRKLLLGSCSKGVCTYHRNIKNLRLTVRSKLKSGSVTYVRKTFVFKI